MCRKEVYLGGFSVYNLLLDASVFVQIIAGTLCTLSIISWGIFFYTLQSLIALNRELRRIAVMVSRSGDMERLYSNTLQSRSCNQLVFKRFFELWRIFHPKPDYVLDTTILQVEESRERAGVLTPWLASIASSSPFIGLLGTVWGIMNSFQSIAQTQETHLSVVAPGIAEALAVTALGLVVAIPATIMYNFLTKALDGYEQRLCDLLVQCIQTLRKQENS